MATLTPRRDRYQAVIASFDRSVDFIVIDTPATDTYLMRVSHLVANTLLTPLNDSFLDFGALAATDPIWLSGSPNANPDSSGLPQAQFECSEEARCFTSGDGAMIESER